MDELGPTVFYCFVIVICGLLVFGIARWTLMPAQLEGYMITTETKYDCDEKRVAVVYHVKAIMKYGEDKYVFSTVDKREAYDMLSRHNKGEFVTGRLKQQLLKYEKGTANGK